MHRNVVVTPGTRANTERVPAEIVIVRAFQCREVGAILQNTGGLQRSIVPERAWSNRIFGQLLQEVSRTVALVTA